MTEEPADDDEVFWGLQREMLDLPVVLEVAFEGDPASKARARFTRKGYKGGHAYTPAKSRQAELAVAAAARRELGNWRVDGSGSFGILVVFFSATFQRRDVDNMLKLVSDALTGVLWVDDAQVSEVSARVVRGDEFPRTHLRVYRTATRQKPTKACLHCGERFIAYASQAKRIYCSGACFQAARRKARERVCAHCGVTFTPKSGGAATYCSVACKSAALTVDLICGWCQQAKRMPQSIAKNRRYCSSECAAAAATEKRIRRPGAGTCEVCSSPTSKKDYAQCRSCRYRTRAAAAAIVRELPEETDDAA